MTIVSSESNQIKVQSFNSRLDKKVAKIKAISDWHLDVFNGTDGNVELPWSADDTYCHATQYVKDSYTDVDAEATIEYLSTVVKYAVSCGFEVKKDYSSYAFKVEVLIPFEDDKITISYTANREAVCTKKVVGVKHHEEQVTPAYDEEIVEWECEKISLLK